MTASNARPDDSVGKWIAGLKCPACGRKDQLFVGYGGFVTCSANDCPNPDYAEALKQHMVAEVQATRQTTIDDIFRLSPTKQFKDWKPQDAAAFYERLKAYETQSAAIENEAAEMSEAWGKTTPYRLRQKRANK